MKKIAIPLSSSPTSCPRFASAVRKVLVLPVLALSLAAGCATHISGEGTDVGPSVVLQNFQLTGNLNSNRASFELIADARVEKQRGGSIELLSGSVVLTQVDPRLKGHLAVRGESYVITFDRAGVFPIKIRFDTAVVQQDGWNVVDFQVAPSALQPVILRGLSQETQFRFSGAARPDRVGTDFVSHLPPDGTVSLSWKEAPAAAEGKLFYSAEMLSQVAVSPGLMRQLALLDFKVMQGELDRVTLRMKGEGEVTRVQGDAVLAWNVESIAGSPDRLIVIQLNQPQKSQFNVQVQMQTPLGAFPQRTEAMWLEPEGTVRFAGHVRVINEGAVRLEVGDARGLSQIAPEQFPENDLTRALFRAGGNQRFVYRFSGAGFALAINADQVHPELFVSQLLSYHLGENEQIIEAEIELDVREAPLRELLLRLPRGYAIARLEAGALSDYFLQEPADATDAELRLVFGQPLSGRQVVQMRIERNEPPPQTNWALPRIEVVRAKSVRGFVGVSSDPGFRLTPERTEALTDVATAFYPRKLPNIHAAFRVNEPGWAALLAVERLPQTVDADAFHLFSIGEGIAYGSSVINYAISGAPIQAFRVELGGEFHNVEFTGKDIRNWQDIQGGYLVQLHTPVSGNYTLLATYERPFRAQGETLTFTGARPQDAQSEKGHTIVISAHQFEARTVEISPGLLPLEPGEVPPEYRLFFDAPVLSAYRYSTRPFSLQLALTPLAQGTSLNQVVDRAVLESHVSKLGHVLTDARYFVKNRGYPHLRVTLPPQTELWSASVNGARVVPVMDAAAHLIPLPLNRAPDSVLEVHLKLAASAKDEKLITVAAPTVAAPVMLAQWNLDPEPNQKLIYRGGSLTPATEATGTSGFAHLLQLSSGPNKSRARNLALMFLGFAAAALLFCRWSVQSHASGARSRSLAGLVFGIITLFLAVVALVRFGFLVDSGIVAGQSGLTFLAPVQQAGSELAVEIANVSEGFAVLRVIGYLWPVCVAGILFAGAWLSPNGMWKMVGRAAAWTALAWAALRLPHGGVAFTAVLSGALIIEMMFPMFSAFWKALASRGGALPESPAGTAQAVTMLLIGGVIAGLLGLETPVRAAEPATTVAPRQTVEEPTNAPMVQSILHEVRIEDGFAIATARLKWRAKRGDKLPLLEPPAVATRLDYPTRSLRLLQSGGDGGSPELLAMDAGDFDISIDYQIHVDEAPSGSGMMLPVPVALIHQLKITIVDAEVGVSSPQAVSLERESIGSNTVATLVLSPSPATRIEWRPRSRDVTREKSVFYADTVHLFVPTAGVVEGAHHISIRPAQGELNELVLDIPQGMTITDVTEAQSANRRVGNSASIVSLWRFDPDQRKLRLSLNPAQSRPFAVVVRSQNAAGTLPFETETGLPTVSNAAGQIGLVGIASGNDVQVTSVDAGSLSPINLEDFPGYLVSTLESQIPGLTLRRAFRHAGVAGFVLLAASAVEPDVRVETQDTLSLSEDRLVLAVNASVAITRAGIFRLSFPLPDGLDVESISGSSMSHWTETRTDAGRVITLHLPGKTLGQQQFTITLSGAGLAITNDWQVPEVVFREAGKQRGTLVVVPELGMRVLVAERGSATQLDPERSGIRQKGVLAFRILDSPAGLSLNVEQVDAWIQVSSLQQGDITEGEAKVTANLNYQIENTGLRALRILVPTNAEGLRFEGDQVADFVRISDSATNGLDAWEVKLHRRVIGQYLLRISYQLLVPAGASRVVLQGVQAADANVQRGFLTVQSDPRLQLAVDAVPTTLQPSEWQAIPRTLLRNASAAAAALTYRLAAPAYELPLTLVRHEAAKLLPARVNNVTFNSAVSDNALMLTHVRMEIVPGDKRLLHLVLPEGARFWFAFVNQNGVWPWREEDRILIPLEQQSRVDQPVIVELFYDCQIGTKNARSLDLTLLAPKFDLPLEDITWRVSLSEKWTVTDWSGDLELQSEEVSPVVTDMTSYLAQQTELQHSRTAQAEGLMAEANRALERGEPQAARRAFQAAYGLSTHDTAFNEDARVQLHNLKLQQALVGLTFRQSAVIGKAAASPGHTGGSAPAIRYTQQDAKDLMDRNRADENSAFLRLAERLIQQQDAATISASALRATLPEQGRILSFKRAVLVDPWAPMKLNLDASHGAGGPMFRVLVLTGVFLLLFFAVMAGRRVVTRQAAE